LVWRSEEKGLEASSLSLWQKRNCFIEERGGGGGKDFRARMGCGLRGKSSDWEGLICKAGERINKMSSARFKKRETGDSKRERGRGGNDPPRKRGRVDCTLLMKRKKKQTGGASKE